MRRNVKTDGPSPVDISVGARVRMRRIVCGLSQKELSQEIGLTFQQLQKYESGFNRISASKLWAISRVLGCEIEWFFQDVVNGTEPDDTQIHKRETLEFVRNFENIQGERLRDDFIELVKTIANESKSAS